MKMLKKLKIFNLRNIVIGLILGIGIVLRCIFYFYNRPFWNDECALALNVTNFWNFFKPLEYNQAAPQLFMYISKIFYYLIPAKELALRFFPFICSILSIWLFFIIAKQYLQKTFSRIVAISAFAICYPLCYYAQEFKQYSSDVLAFLLAISSYFYIDRIIANKKNTYLYGIILSILLWLSFSSFFAVLGVLATILLFPKSSLSKLRMPLLIIGINCLLIFYTNIHLNSNEYLHSYWQSSFINWNFSNFPKLIFDNCFYIFSSIYAEFFIITTIIISLIKEKGKAISCLLITPLTLSLLFAYCKIYPFSTRIILFLIPIFILLYAKLIDFVNIKNKIFSNIIKILICATVIIPMAINNYNLILKKNYTNEDIVTLLNTTKNLATRNDIVYISEGNSILFEYYKYLIPNNFSVFIEQTNYASQKEYTAHLSTNLEHGKTYYWIFAHHKNKQERLNEVYMWAKNKSNFKIFVDKNYNALIIFTN